MWTLLSALGVIHLGIHHNCITHLLLSRPFLSPSCLNIHLSHLLPIRKLEGGREGFWDCSDAPTIHIKNGGGLWSSTSTACGVLINHLLSIIQNGCQIPVAASVEPALTLPPMLVSHAEPTSKTNIIQMNCLTVIKTIVCPYMQNSVKLK